MLSERRARVSTSSPRSPALPPHFARHVCVFAQYARKRVVVWGGPELKAQPACDHEPLDLVRALADLQHLLVAVEARDRILVHEAVAAVDLQCRVDGAVRQLAGVELRDRRRLREWLLLI